MYKMDSYVSKVFEKYLNWLKDNNLDDTFDNFMFYIDNVEKAIINIYP